MPEDLIFKENALLQAIAICFKFKDNNEQKTYRRILKELSDKKLDFINTQIAKFGDCCYLFRYNVRIRDSDFAHFKEFKDIDDKFIEIIDKITVERPPELELEWLGKKDQTIKEISLNQFHSILSIFIKGINSAHLEMILAHAILKTKDMTLSEEDIAQLGLIDNKDIITLFQNTKLSGKEIQQIINSVNTTDFIILKQVFRLIIKKSNFTPLKLYNEFIRVKGEEPFNKKLLDFIWNDELADDCCRLEMFLKEYIRLNGIIQNIRIDLERNQELLKIRIPLDIAPYKPENYTLIEEKLREYFLERKALILSLFNLVLKSELRRLNIAFKSVLISFNFENSDKGIEELRDREIYYDDLKTLYDKNLESFRNATKEGEINQFVIFHGNCIKSRNHIFDWIKKFYVRDQKRHTIQCQIHHNFAYFSGLPLEMESELIMQANLKLVYTYDKKLREATITEKYLNIIDMQVIDNFESVECHLGYGRGQEYVLSNNIEGIKLYTYSKKNAGKVLGEKPILSKPIQLLNIFKDQEVTAQKKFYEIKVNGDVVHKNFDDLIHHFFEELLVDDDRAINTRIRQILRESQKQFGLKYKPFYRTAGIFLNENEELKIIYEDLDDVRIIPETAIQEEYVEKIRAKELDKTGKLTEHFFKITNLPTIPTNVRLSALGFSAISPFFDALSYDLEVFPILLLWGPPTTGKSQTLVLYLNLLYGSSLRNNDDIDSTSRYTLFLTECTFAIVLDDMDKFEDKLVAFTKSYCTTRGGKRYRNTPSQNMNKTRMYSSLCGSFNKREFLTKIDDDAFNIRCIIHHLKSSLKNNPDLMPYFREFKAQKRIIKKSNLIYGYYVMEKALEYIDGLYQNEGLSNYKKLLRLYDDIYLKIEGAVIKLRVDIRRIEILTHIYIGWLMWDYVFKTKNLNCELLKNALDLESETFTEYIKELETAEKEINEELIEMIYEFFFQNRTKYLKFVRTSKEPSVNGKWVITSEFIADYDDWAIRRRYGTLKSLTHLADFLSKLSNTEVGIIRASYEDKNREFKNTYFKGRGKVIQIELGDFIKIRYPDFTDVEVLQVKEQLLSAVEDQINTGKIDMDKIFGGPAKAHVEKLQLFLDILKPIFEENKEYIELDSLKMALELNFDKEFIESTLADLMNDGTLIQKDNEVKLKLMYP